MGYVVTELLGQTIGNCRIEALIGSGGMGQVFRARHIHLNRAQALKVLHEQLSLDASFQTRFRHEARALAMLEHKHCVRIYECADDQGHLYLSMELIQDGSLRTLLDRRGPERHRWADQERRQWRLVGLDLARQAAEALAFAHERGIIHRDIKPDNLLIARNRRPDGTSNLELKVADFGLAQIADTGSLTASGFTVGTPTYMSPEQCQARELDARSDIYSLGIVLYELLTGYLPFAAKSASEIVRKHLHELPRPPREIEPSLSPAVEALLLRCLDKEPGDRFAGAAELAAALRELIAAESAEPQVTPAPAPAIPAGFRVRVVDAQGQTVRTLPLREQGLSVGRSQGNDLVLEGESVSRSHLRITHGRTRARATDLGARNVTTIAGRALTPFVEEPWHIGEPLQIGLYTLYVEPAPPAALVVSVVGGSSTVSLTPGQTVTIPLVIANQGEQLDGVVLGVEGVPAEWVRLPAQRLNLRAGGSATVALVIRPPQGSAARAGNHAVVIRAATDAEPAVGGEALMQWQIAAVPAAELSLTPAELTTNEEGRFVLALHNTGNVRSRYRLAANDSAGKLSFNFANEQAELDPGDSLEIGLTVKAPKRMLGRRRLFPFTVRAAAAEQTHEATATLIQDGPLLF